MNKEKSIDWDAFDRRVRELEQKRKPSANRRAVLEAVKASSLLPHPEFDPSLYLGALIDPAGKPICLEYTGDRPNIWFHSDHVGKLEGAGFALERKPASGPDSEGRHHGLKGKGFRDIDAWKLADLTSEKVKSALQALGFLKDSAPNTTQSQLSRDCIEAAMDAFDRFRENGEFEEDFGGFGDPRDYWVRSTRDRANRVYPTKPLIGSILKKKELNGGWGQKPDAAARLHNSGFIIVGEDDKPVPPPERYAHLVRDADRIRLCALNYFIEPARERGEFEVSIRAGDLAAAMGLQDAFPNICQALGGEKFQQLARVPPPTHTEPNPSSSTIFTYKLASQAEAATVTEENTTPTRSATNLILYGPPGTGKTYRTAWEAVRLCLGEQAAASLQGDEKRDALMAEYRRLVSEGRIEFVTFHQSMSYEEFVEGLRPSTGDDAGEGPEEVEVGTGFRLKPYDGVFKRVSERARLDQTGGNSSARLDRSARVFKVALGRRQVEDERIRFGLDNGLIHVGWGGDIDWSDERFDDFNEIFSEWRTKKDAEATGHDGNIVITFSFRADMQVGDYVVVSDGRDRSRHLEE